MNQKWKTTYSSMSRAQSGERNCDVELIASSYDDMVKKVADLGDEVRGFSGGLWMEGHSTIGDLTRDANNLAAKSIEVRKRALDKLTDVEKIALGLNNS